jgi:subtilisin family serine protease
MGTNAGGFLSDKALAGIDPFLREKLAQAPPGEMLQVTLVLERQADVQGLLARAGSLTARERHATVVRALMEVARETQPPVLAVLADLEERGLVRSSKGLWIANLVEVTARADAMALLEEIPGVREVTLTPKAVPVGFVPADPAPEDAEEGPLVIGADSLWRLGWTGATRVVGHIDTGVEGTHPSLTERWRGNVEPPEECWLAPGTDYPFDEGGHGTATMGCLTGRDSATGDTIGVALDALWISAMALGGEHSVSTRAALQWMADPDGNPETIDDVPDVVSNSWIYIPETSCFESEWDVIDNVEAAGSVVMFAAGNAGPGAGTVASPGSRNTSDLNGFAVGAVDVQKRIAGFSSRGPSPCDDVTVKPEVAAPGVNARTSVMGGGYANASGTSIACPFAAGVVALLRQLNPEATVEEIKTALLESAEDRGPGGDDNDFGMGVVDAYRAAEIVSPYRVAGTITDQSTGLPVPSAEILVRETGQNESADAEGTYDVGALASSVSLVFRKFGYVPDTTAVLSLGDSTLVYDVELVPLAKATLEGTVIDTLTGGGIRAGVILYSNGEAVDTVLSAEGTGFFRFADVPASSPPLVVYDRLEGRFVKPYPASIVYADTLTLEPGDTVNVELRAAPAHVLIADDDEGLSFEKYITSAVDTAGWTYYHHDVQATGESIVRSLQDFPPGTVLLWYTAWKEETLTDAEQESLSAFLDRGGKLLLTGQNIAEDLSGEGSPFLEERLHASWGGLSGFKDVQGAPGDPIFDGLLLRTEGLGGAYDQYSRDVLIEDGYSVPACFYSQPGSEGDSLVAGLLIDNSESDGSRIVFLGFGFEAVVRPGSDTTYATRSEAMARILGWLDEGVVGIDPGNDPEGGSLPRSFRLSQNFPNPFNPVTTIGFDIPEVRGEKSARVRLVIHDLRGRVVRVLLDREFPAGRHEVAWDGRSGNGERVPSGVYLYHLSVEERNYTKKMLLLR